MDASDRKISIRKPKLTHDNSTELNEELIIELNGLVKLEFSSEENMKNFLEKILRIFDLD